MSRLSRAVLLLIVAGAAVWPAASALAGSHGGPAATAGVAPVAPYVDMTLTDPPPNLAAVSRATGLRHFTLAFIVDQDNCHGGWGPGVGGAPIAHDISALRARGGDVIVSFGGADGTELALGCRSLSALTTQYQSAITAYRLTSIDFDVEGAAVADGASIDRRSAAIAALERRASAAHRRLQVSLTLPVLPSGLDPYGLYVVRSAIAHHARIDVVNVMAMDYGDEPAPNPAGQMGRDAIASAIATHAQLSGLYRGKTSAQLWRMVGVTPMIGVNDQADEIFGLADARQLVNFARAKHLGRLPFWSEARDRQCPGGLQTYAQDSCSSILQATWAFSRAFGAYHG